VVERDKVYVFFSHTIKGQPHNMAMLRSLVEQGCTLLDYELIKDDQGRRLVFFGRYAGLAGMIDTLWTLGQRLLALGIDTPFKEITQAHEFPSLQVARETISQAGRAIEEQGLPGEIVPLVFGFTGYGNVSQGAQEIFDLLPYVEVQPRDLPEIVAASSKVDRKLIKVVYHEEHMVAPNDPARRFDLLEYFNHPDRYHTTFEPHLELLSVVLNGIFWTEKYPRLATREQLQALFSGGKRPKLLVAGDVSCDVNGSLACTVRETEPGHPVYVYNPLTGEAPMGFSGPGLAVMSVGNLPCELPMEASAFFSSVLHRYIEPLAGMRLDVPFSECHLPAELKRSVILWRGEFTPPFTYMREFVS
jgi:alpha-aminoadipic semialdehyde synthase